jgi:hypothetical protein
MLQAMNFKQTMSQIMGAMGAQIPQMTDQMLGSAAMSTELSKSECAELGKSAKEAQSKAFAEMNAIVEKTTKLLVAKVEMKKQEAGGARK